MTAVVATEPEPLSEEFIETVKLQLDWFIEENEDEVNLLFCVFFRV